MSSVCWISYSQNLFVSDPDGINLFRAGDATLVDAARGIYRAPIITRAEIDREISNVHTFTAKVMSCLLYTSDAADES